MEPRTRGKFNAQIYEEACGWFVECRTRDLDETARAELDHWLRKSPEHLAAYLEIAAIWNEGPSLDPQSRWDADALVAQAAQDADNLVVLDTAARGEMAQHVAAVRAPASASSAPVSTNGARGLRPWRLAPLVAVAEANGASVRGQGPDAHAIGQELGVQPDFE